MKNKQIKKTDLTVQQVSSFIIFFFYLRWMHTFKKNNKKPPKKLLLLIPAGTTHAESHCKQQWAPMNSFGVRVLSGMTCR